MDAARDPQTPTMADVARKAGVSPMTVSRVFQGMRFVQPGDTQSVLRVRTGGTHRAGPANFCQTPAFPSSTPGIFRKMRSAHIVSFSNARATREMVDHLVIADLQDIAFLGGTRLRYTRQSRSVTWATPRPAQAAFPT
jgi:DNA-binding MurR/RpiR family transcriptional regulator